MLSPATLSAWPSAAMPEVPVDIMLTIDMVFSLRFSARNYD
jgi:hypothetical protein